MSRPVVSVVTNSFNSGSYLRANIESMLRQEYGDWEHLVVDCGSTDDSLDVLSAADHDRLRVFRVPFCGVSSGRNIGIERARGSIIAILDSDDCAMPDRLKEQVGFLTSMPDVLGVGSGIIRIDEATGRRRTSLYPASPRQIAILLRAGFNPIPHSTFTFRLSAFRAVGGYSSTIEKGEDFELMLRMSQRGPLSTISRALVECKDRFDSHTNRHRPRGRDVRFYAALSLILNSGGENAGKISQAMAETWLESIGADGVRALLAEWSLRSIHDNWTDLDWRSVLRLILTAYSQGQGAIAFRGREWRGFSRSPETVAAHLLSESCPSELAVERSFSAGDTK